MTIGGKQRSHGIDGCIQYTPSRCSPRYTLMLLLRVISVPPAFHHCANFSASQFPETLRTLGSGQLELSLVRAMSKRSVADVLMGAARAAAKKDRGSVAKNSDNMRSEQSKTKSQLLIPIPVTPTGEEASSPAKKQKTLDSNDHSGTSSSRSQLPVSNSISIAIGDISSSVPIDDKIAKLTEKGADFRPESAALWKKGDPVPFLFLARAFELIQNETRRISITDILCNVFRTVIATTPDDLLSTVYLSANKIAPAHEGTELGIGDASLIRALVEAYGRSEERIKQQLNILGDLGLVAKECRLSQKTMFKPRPLTVKEVLSTFRAIAKESGKDSQEKKRTHIRKLLVAATGCEPLYLVRLLQSKMRTGVAEQTVLASLGQAAVHSDELPSAPPQIQSPLVEAVKIVKQVYQVLPMYDKIIPALLEHGVWKLAETCRFTLGVPLGPMLAKPTKGVSEILDKFQGMEFTCEYKYDGERAQIHYMEDGSVEIYSRNAEQNTGKFPDVVNAVSRFKKSSVRSFVLDCEIVAYDCEKQKILPFQILSTRARKDVTLTDIKVAVCIFAFDLLYLNGQLLLQEQLKNRRELLYGSFEEVKGVFHFANSITTNEVEEIQKFLEDALSESCEGLIIKTLNQDATYEPAERSHNWLKLKKDYMDSLGDSLDLVPIAAFHGRGKRTGVYGAFLLACYDDHKDEYQSICKIGTGFSEVMLEERSKSLHDKVITRPKTYYCYADTMNPDVWFEPSQVWEVKAADLSISPVHRAAIGIVDINKGISLRFPRLLRVREDKNSDQATTSDQVAEMYRAQKINHASR